MSVNSAKSFSMPLKGKEYLIGRNLSTNAPDTDTSIHLPQHLQNIGTYHFLNQRLKIDVNEIYFLNSFLLWNWFAYFAAVHGTQRARLSLPARSFFALETCSVP